MQNLNSNVKVGQLRVWEEPWATDAGFRTGMFLVLDVVSYWAHSNTFVYYLDLKTGEVANHTRIVVESHSELVAEVEDT